MGIGVILQPAAPVRCKFKTDNHTSEQEEASSYLKKNKTYILHNISISGASGWSSLSVPDQNEPLFYLVPNMSPYLHPQAALLAPVDDELVFDRKPAGSSSKVPDFPPPAGREILLRTCVPRPAPYSKALPQRLFCVLMRDEFRLAGAFSSDTSFF